MIVTIANHKGGVGKTSLAAHLAFRGAERGRVLAVDFDAQGNLTATLADRAKAMRSDGAERLFSPVRRSGTHLRINFAAAQDPRFWKLLAEQRELLV